MDTKYINVALELDSQGFGGRKRAKTEKYLEAWSWGGSRFDPAHEEESTGGYDLARARRKLFIASYLDNSRGDCWFHTDIDADDNAQFKSRERTKISKRTTRISSQGWPTPSDLPSLLFNCPGSHERDTTPAGLSPPQRTTRLFSQSYSHSSSSKYTQDRSMSQHSGSNRTQRTLQSLNPHSLVQRKRRSCLAVA